MNKYKVGDKFIVEVTGNVLCADKDVSAYELNDMCVVSEVVLDKCEKVKGTYEDGLNDAWDAACKIGKLSCDGGWNTAQLSKVFDSPLGTEIFRKYSAKEAIERIKRYECKTEQEKIKFGDEVTSVVDSINYGVVLHTFNDGCDVFWKHNGSVETFVDSMLDELKKTGNNYAKDVSALLNRIGE